MIRREGGKEADNKVGRVIRREGDKEVGDKVGG